jgi:ribosomal protein L29
MAIKKTTKIVKKADEIMTIDQLQAELLTSRTNLIEAKRGNRLGELTNPRVITVTRKKIARILTAIRAAEIVSTKENK